MTHCGRSLGWLGASLAVILVTACGGRQHTASGDEESQVSEEGGGEESGSGEAIVPSEKYDEIERLFKMKRPQVARCYGNAVERKEIDAKTKGRVTIALTLKANGQVDKLRISESTLAPEAPAVEACVLGLVREWSFPAPGATIETSFSYDFEPW